MIAASSLKGGNIRWLVSVATLDIVAVATLLAPTFASSDTTIQYTIKGIIAILLPVLVPAITDSISHNVKARLVFWKWKYPLPGHRAFSLYAAEASGVDPVALARNVGTFPVEPAQQGHRWYELFHLVRDRENVSETHRKYLLYRDLAAMSLVLLITVPVFCGLVLKINVLWICIFLLFQTIWAIWLCRIAGDRFVSTVLIIHSVEAVPGVAEIRKRARVRKD